MVGMLVAFHTQSNEGFAMHPLEKVFFKVACQITGRADFVHMSFTSLDKGHPRSLPRDFKNVLRLSKYDPDRKEAKFISRYVKDNKIKIAFFFDLRPNSSICKLLRKNGVRTIVSYWGAPMSDYNSLLKLTLKKMEILLYRNRPDLFIFESEAMRDLAVNGRGLSLSRTCVVPTGVDTKKFTPAKRNRGYLSRQFGIGKDEFVIVYTGHMEKRKGVHVIMASAIKLVDDLGLKNIKFLICGNRPGEEEIFLNTLRASNASDNVIFSGYRDDLDVILPSCDIGVIASTGWDSFPMSSQEMAACGLPIVVSRLQGLVETVENGVTGMLFEPGDANELSECVLSLLNDSEKRKSMSKAARRRVESGYSIDIQVERLISVVNRVIENK